MANGEGGAIASFSTLTANNAIFEENTAKGNEVGNYDGGGAILVGASSISDISNTKFIKNHAAGTIGGAVATRRTHDNIDSSSLKINNSLFDNNDAAEGGVVYNSFIKNAEIANSTFTNNIATNSGGAIYNETKGVLSLSGTNKFSGNKAKGELNDIHNLGKIDVSGSLTLDGGISGHGTTTFAEGAQLTVNTGTTTHL